MPECRYTTTMPLPREDVWEFVKDMNNWAPFVTGYQKHEALSETDSIWTLKGDVGILSRVVELKAHVTEWNGPERVTFTLTGLNESVDGEGVLTMEPAALEAPAPPPPSLWKRLVKWLFALFTGGGAARAELPAGTRAASRLTFFLKMEAGGAMGPLVNAMLGPALEPAAEELATKIAAHLAKAPAAKAA
jgi:carbon monoxide dehydrogenase subunit G